MNSYYVYYKTDKLHSIKVSEVSDHVEAIKAVKELYPFNTVLVRIK